MSVLRRCDFWLATDGNWYLRLGRHEHDWEDYQCTVYGPFSTYEQANQYRYDNFSNPGGQEVDSTGTTPPPVDPESPLPKSSIIFYR
jgi:hypothetical protein